MGCQNQADRVLKWQGWGVRGHTSLPLLILIFQPSHVRACARLPAPVRKCMIALSCFSGLHRTETWHTSAHVCTAIGNCTGRAVCMRQGQNPPTVVCLESLPSVQLPGRRAESHTDV